MVKENKLAGRGHIHILVPGTRFATLGPAEPVVRYDRQQDKTTDFYLAKHEMAALMDGTSLPDEGQKLVLSFFRFDVEKRRGDPSRSPLLMSVEPREPPTAIVWDEPLIYALVASTRQLHGAELPSFAEIASMGSVEKVGLMELCSYYQTYALATKAATQIRNDSATQRAFADFKTLLDKIMKRRNVTSHYGRAKGETMEKYWLRLKKIPKRTQDNQLRKLRQLIEDIRRCSSVSAQGKVPKWAGDNRDWFVDNKCPYAPPREEPDADELAWVGRRYRDDEGVWRIKKVEFSPRDKELAVWAYRAHEEPPEDDDELERELLGPFKEALDDGDNVWVESE